MKMRDREFVRKYDSETALAVMIMIVEHAELFFFIHRVGKVGRAATESWGCRVTVLQTIGLKKTKSIQKKTKHILIVCLKLCIRSMFSITKVVVNQVFLVSIRTSKPM